MLKRLKNICNERVGKQNIKRKSHSLNEKIKATPHELKINDG